MPDPLVLLCQIIAEKPPGAFPRRTPLTLVASLRGAMAAAPDVAASAPDRSARVSK